MVKKALIRLYRRLVPQYAVFIRHENPDLTTSERPARAYAEDWGAQYNPLDALFTWDNWDRALAYSKYRSSKVRSDQNRYFVVRRAL